MGAHQSLAGERCLVRPHFPDQAKVTASDRAMLRDLGDGLYELTLKIKEETTLYAGDVPPEGK